jgi:hypothetical protein
MEKWQFTLGALVVGSVVAYFTLGRREKNMRSLAAKFGFDFIGTNFQRPFQMDCYPISEIKKRGMRSRAFAKDYKQFFSISHLPTYN